MEDDLLTICLLGTFQIARGRETITGLEQARLQELLAYLLLHRGRPILRQSLAFLFWPDSTEKQARTNSRNLWHRLRHTFPEVDRCLAADDLAVQWRGDASCWLDVAMFETRLAQAQTTSDPRARIAYLEQAAALYGGELLPGCYSDWLLPERERLAHAYSYTLDHLIALHESCRQYEQAIGHARTLLRHDPLHEPAYTDLMRLHALNDDRAAALHTYHTCVTILRRELDVAPGQPTRDLYERLLNQENAPSTLPQTRAAIPLVGRENRWAQLQQTWREAATRPRLALISGEAGIGKSRLAEALLEWVERQGIPALTARCYATESELAYAPLVTWLHGQPLPALADPWLRELARLLPEILVEYPHLPPPEPLTEPWQRLRLFEALARALLPHHSALLLVLDDLQWCDQDTLDWLHFVLTDARIQAEQPQLLVVTTVRSGERGAGAKLSAWRAGLVHTDQLVELALGPLNQAATLALAEHVAERPFTPSLGSLLYLGTEGHPLFIVEMVRAGFAEVMSVSETALADHAAAMLARQNPLPGRIRQVLEARLSQLSPAAQGVMAAAAVIGRAFTYDVLRRTVDLSEDELVNCLDEGWRRRIIREQGDDAYDFSHDKLREVAYDGLSQTRRRWLHGRVAQALETIYANDLDGAAGMISWHYEAARLPQKAIAYYQRAAAAARRIYAHQEAVAALEKAFSLLRVLPAEAARGDLTAQLQEMWGDLQSWLANHEAARAAFEAALAQTPPGDTIAQARLHRKIGKVLENAQTHYEQAAAYYETALALLGTPDGEAPSAEASAAWWEEWCQIQLEQLLLCYWWQRPDEMARFAQVQPLIERHGTLFQRADLLLNLIRILNRNGRFAPSSTAVNYARAALEMLPPAAKPEWYGQYQFVLGFNLLWYGAYAEATTSLHTALVVAEQIGDVSLQTRCLAYLLVTARRQGCDADVARYARRCLELASSVKMLDYLGAAQAGLAWLAWRQGQAAEVQCLAQAALAAWDTYPASYPLYWQALWPLLGIYLAQGCLAEAIPYARQLCHPAQQILPSNLEELLTQALAAWDDGRSDTADQLLRHTLTTAQQMNFT